MSGVPWRFHRTDWWHRPTICTRKQNPTEKWFATLRVFNGTMRPRGAADPLPFKSHPCPLFCLHPANNMYTHKRRLKREFILTSSSSGGQKREGQVRRVKGNSVSEFGWVHIYRALFQPGQMRSAKWFPEPAPLTSVWPIRGRSRAKLQSRDRENDEITLVSILSIYLYLWWLSAHLSQPDSCC